MTLRLTTLAEFEALKNRDKGKLRIDGIADSPSKFHSVMCEADNIKFRSKKERKRYLELKALQHAGEVSYFHRQVPFDLPGNTRYIVDFLIFWSDGCRTYEDVKGQRLASYIRNKKQVEALYPVKIIEP